MFRLTGSLGLEHSASPHTRGDVPDDDDYIASLADFSPHTWGCSSRTAARISARILLPTHVGMFRRSSTAAGSWTASPHTRGDVPQTLSAPVFSLAFSPHTWGCSESRNGSSQRVRLLPTHVGMFRRDVLPGRRQTPSPHTRGDVPIMTARVAPRPHFSPHTWGCSGSQGEVDAVDSLLPTHVGMFRSRVARPRSSRTSPHTRGDVPSSGCAVRPVGSFSPHTWGCSEGRRRSREARSLLPTHVGMFRVHNPKRRPRNSSPHTRGDVP